MADIDLEAANRLRVAMGLKPIEIPGGPSFKAANGAPAEEAASTIETRQAAAYDNYNQRIKDEEAKEKRKAQKEAIKKARDMAMRDVQMTGKTLGEDEQDLDTGAWLRQQAKRRKKIENARRLEEELAAREVQAEYTSKDLAGVKVGHELGQFEAGDEQILTLKDAEIGDESDDDELENVSLRDKERLQEKLELKKRKPIYDPNADDDGEKGILSHYDEEIDGKKQHKFTLDGFGSTKESTTLDVNGAKQVSKGVVISLDFLQETAPISDYVESSEVKIRKPKKSKKSKSTRIKAVEDDDIFTGEGSNGTGSLAATKKRTIDQANFVDDDDLQARLAQQRREALKKKKRIRPEDLAKQMKEEEENAMDVLQESVENEPGLILDETSEFVNHLEAPEDREEAKPSARAQSQSHAKAEQSSDEDEDVKMEDQSAEPEEQQKNGIEEKSNGAVGLEEEATIERGIGATLSMLRQRKHIATNDNARDSSGGGGGLADTFRDHEHFISKRRAREDDAEKKAKQQRERDRQSGRLERMSAREREDYARQSNVHREQVESRALADLYNKEYKPNIELKYIDEFGRSMNQKEAFKHLSHQFHGKGSGKQKHDKRLKKIEEEKKRESMSTLDSSAHVSSAAMGNKAKKNQQAGVRLQ